jgi:hypothetical protein
MPLDEVLQVLLIAVGVGIVIGGLVFAVAFLYGV